MKDKIKIGEKEYRLPFKYYENVQAVCDGDGKYFCEVNFTHTASLSHPIGYFIADAINEKAEKL